MELRLWIQPFEAMHPAISNPGPESCASTASLANGQSATTSILKLKSFLRPRRPNVDSSVALFRTLLHFEPV
jgi:hypothetical protein